MARCHSVNDVGQRSQAKTQNWQFKSGAAITVSAFLPTKAFVERYFPFVQEQHIITNLKFGSTYWHVVRE
jgi:hypothetical protein